MLKKLISFTVTKILAAVTKYLFEDPCIVSVLLNLRL